jgi:hypothetical protein
MPDQSHREEMSAAIRAQRERSAAPRTIAPEPPPAPPLPAAAEPDAPEPAKRPGLFARLRGK